jgi:hypothetical protein
MKKIFLIIITFIAFYACETSENISFDLDHEVPSYSVLTDSLEVEKGQTVLLKVVVSDNAGIGKVVFSYGEWQIRESITLDDTPKSYTYETSVTIPVDAATEWQEELILNDGSKQTVTQHYHKLLLEATDINMNVRNIPIYIKIK